MSISSRRRHNRRKQNLKDDHFVYAAKAINKKSTDDFKVWYDIQKTKHHYEFTRDGILRQVNLYELLFEECDQRFLPIWWDDCVGVNKNYHFIDHIIRRFTDKKIFKFWFNKIIENRKDLFECHCKEFISYNFKNVDVWGKYLNKEILSERVFYSRICQREFINNFKYWWKPDLFVYVDIFYRNMMIKSLETSYQHVRDRWEKQVFMWKLQDPIQ